MIRVCQCCSKLLERKREGKRQALEKLHRFAKRKFCNKKCEQVIRIKPRPYTDEKLIEDYQTLSHRQIARKYGIAHCLVWRDLKRLVPKSQRITAHPRKGKYRGTDNPTWKGGRFIARGYVMIRNMDHPNANPNGYVKEHVMVACKKYNLPKIYAPQVIHHIDFDKENNSPDNLELMKNHSSHARLHRQFLHCGQELMRRGYIQFDSKQGYTLTSKSYYPCT